MPSKKKYKTPAYRASKRRHKQRQIDKKNIVRDEMKAQGCSLCGYSKCFSALEFHHINADKEKTIGWTKTTTEFLRESSKCVLVCSNCHREIHAGQIEVYAPIETRVVEELPLLRLINNDKN
jgi:hypothetical protein